MRSLRTPFVAALLAAATLSIGTITIRPSVFPAAEVADGRSQIAVSAQVFQDGRAAPDGTQIIFETTLGSFRESVVSTRNGWARATLVAGGVPGVARIKVTASVGDATGSTTEVEFVKSREELSVARETIEATSTGSLIFANDTRIIEGVAPDRGVSIRYRDLEIHADMVQLDLASFSLKAKKALVRQGRRTILYDSLSLDLAKHTGYGLTNYPTTRPESINPIPGGLAFTEPNAEGDSGVARPRTRFGMVELGRSGDRPLLTPLAEDPFEMADISGSPSTIGARKVVVYARREVQFHRADVYVNNTRIMRMPLFVVNLNGGSGSPLVTDDLLSVNDNQIALNYPHYLSLKPGMTSLLRFRMGERYGQGLTASRGAFLDYELKWSKGDDMTGGFNYSGLGRSDWNATMSQFWRMDSQTSANLQVNSPGGNSVFGSGSVTRALGTKYTLALNGSQNRSFDKLKTGFKDIQSYSLSMERNAERIPETPFRVSYGLTANDSKTVIPSFVGGKTRGLQTLRQTGAGFTARMFSDSINLDKASSLTGSFSATKLFGPQVINQGVGLNGSLSLTRRFSNSANAIVTYNYLRDGISERITGQHSVSLIGNYGLGKTQFSFAANKGIGVDRLNFSADASYRVSGLWRVSYTHFLNDSAFGNLSEYFAILSYRIGWREVGLTWSSRTRRPGVQLLNVNL